MGKLLHSKTFRANLFKWVCLYISALFVITTVVTYSRYITKDTIKDSARTAKFNVDIIFDKICSTSSPGLCNLDTYKPYDEIEYYFTIDTTKLEVLSDLVVTINIDQEFQIISFDYINANQNFVLSNTNTFSKTLSDGTKMYYNNDTDEDDDEEEKIINKITLISESGAFKGTKNQYKIKIKFKKDEYDSNYSKVHDYEKVVKIGYSAKQKI